MREQLLDRKIRKDADRLKKDLRTLAEDSAARISELEGMVSQDYIKAKKDLAKQVDPLRKDIVRRSRDFIANAKEIAVELPKNIDKKASRFPWAGLITIGLVFGFVLGFVVKPGR